MREFYQIVALCAGIALSGCASVDESLFGKAAPAAERSTTPTPEGTGAEADQAASSSSEAQAVVAPPQGAGETGSEQPTGSTPGTLPTVPGESAIAEPTPSEPPPSSAASAGVSAPVVPESGAAASGAPAVGMVSIQPGRDTGTAVSQTIAGIRAKLQDGASRVAGAGQQYANLRSSSAQQLATYYQAQAQIAAHLQIGTTKGNPELVAEWNAAQAALDRLTANVNALSTLAVEIGGEATRVRETVSQIQQASQTPGANDEDHRQLSVLEDEANQIVVTLDRLARDAAADLRRETAALSTERGRLSQLAAGIRAGDLNLGVASAAPSAPVAGSGSGGAPIATIRFARAHTNYQKSLYEALSQALKNQPSASFNVVGVSPTRGSAAAVQAGQTAARQHAQEVMQTMTQMGVPATRMEISSVTDPTVRSSEVHVFVR